ncbi:ATP-dependent endonuclease [Chitinophaga pinensis]|uniref:ATP-dependent endonuclease, OLD family n=1 Tax=Chitinophaga pinensis (strain ATCC 43595 / DSM 2588 / LMG 13176 / NBRC 15968 / NCIMB 11800 / UQM 2034) TaxID=485918 RepID=A0A979G6L1_CHIPD|nr:ATP-dependent endonuclease [Chitinophaga pinensis]ACU61675.1 ATP-dependent endonuclease, OLD family [Chitinophaga pinensis DSM 2588]
MYLKTICIKNYRRLKDVKINIQKDTTIFVGANNSGKTSATHIFQSFLSGKADFSLHDFSVDCWKLIKDISQSTNIVEDIYKLPTISLDLWFEVSEDDLNYIIDLLPNLDWASQPVGIRLMYAPKGHDNLLLEYQTAKADAQKKGKDMFQPWPKDLSDYLTKRLNQEYEINYFVLDATQFDRNYNIIDPSYTPHALHEDKDNKKTGAAIIRSLIKVDFLNAQRHLSDNISTGRSEDLSKRFNRFYDRNLEKRENDPEIYKALFDSESLLTQHLEKVFQPTLDSLNKLGYPGFTNPKLVIKAAYSQESVSQYAQLHYSIGDLDLPDKYNGLGFKNLIYMVIEILDFHERWKEDTDTKAPLHLILIEEPEAHLHAQLQQVFIRQILNIINPSGQNDGFNTQLIVSTHSPHIIYESGFLPIRYFRRTSEVSKSPVSEVLNLSTFYNESEKDSREFLEKYMKLTHCDLFFADAAILVEGNVERLLLPLMIEKCQKSLQSNYLSVIEVGGAFAYRFEQLISFLGLTTLVITDLDSVFPPKPLPPNNETTESADKSEKSEEEDNEEDIEEDDYDDEEDSEEEEQKGKTKKKTGACSYSTPDAITSNYTLRHWLPKKTKIAEILTCSEQERTRIQSATNRASVQVCFQNKVEINWEGKTDTNCGRTLEEAFAFENLEWTQKIENKHLNLRVILKTKQLTVSEISARISRRVQSSNFEKTNFALGLLMANADEWNVPVYIKDGLYWLDKMLNPPHPFNTLPEYVNIHEDTILQPTFPAEEGEKEPNTFE